MLDENQIRGIVASEESSAIGFLGEGSEIQRKRDLLLKYYFSEEFGDEAEGQSRVVTSDVQDVIEGMLPSMLRLFIQGRTVARFEADLPEYEEEADAKTAVANHIFLRMNNGPLILHTAFKDALTQFTGVMKVSYREEDIVIPKAFRGLSEAEVKALVAKGAENVETDKQEDGTYNVRCVIKRTEKRYDIENIPPEETLINRDARDWKKPRFIGQRTPKTRSELVQMGFDKEQVWSLSSEEGFETEGEAIRRDEFDPLVDVVDKSQQVIYLGEYYIQIDADEDGIAEYYQVFYAGGELLEKKQVEDHPYGVCIPIPIPHRAIGTCPAEQVADIQKVKSVLVRQLNDNIYQTNYVRHAVNERVDLDDLLTPRAGGVVRVDGEGPIGDSVLPLPVTPIAGEVLAAIEYWDTTREARTGVTRYNQGLDAEALNKTATGFKGMMDASQQRMYLIALMMAESGVRQIFEKIIKLVATHQSEVMQINALGKPLEIDPTTWASNCRCSIDIGIGAGDRNEKIANLSVILNEQKALKQLGSIMVDDAKMYNAYEQLIEEVGLKDVMRYFNNPEVPEDILLAQMEQAKEVLAMVGQQNPLAEAEQVKAEANKEIAVLREQIGLLKEEVKANTKSQELEAKMLKDRQDMLAKLAELELKYSQQIPGVDFELRDGQLVQIGG